MLERDVMHEAVSARLVLSAVLGETLLGAALVYGRPAGIGIAPLIVVQALWLYRLYVVAHEAVHRKLFPRHPRLNDLCGRLLLLPMAAPLSVYRKVHGYHHGWNRKDARHAALDHFAVRGPVSAAKRRWLHGVWLFYVFGGGFFLHSLITILIFLLLPGRLARRIDPVFVGWSRRERAWAWLELTAAVGFHAAVIRWVGGGAWAIALGLPLALFAWLWSLFLYVYHYRTSVGPDVRRNVRSLPAHPFFSWLLLNFNEHTTHHADPSWPWYELPRRRVVLPSERDSDDSSNESFDASQGTLWAAVLAQARGPILVEVSEAPAAEPSS